MNGNGFYAPFYWRFNHTFLMNTSDGRSASSLGNPIYVGGYGLFLFAIGWLMVMREKGMFWKSLAGVVGLLGFLGVFFSGSRGAFVGLAACVGVLIISYILSLKGHKKVRRILSSVVVASVLIMGILYLHEIYLIKFIYNLDYIHFFNFFLFFY